MQNIFQKIGILSLICLSFIYTERAAVLLRDKDEIMVKIKSANSIHSVEPVSAIVKDNTIIPGIAGRKINAQKSYQKLKKIGYFDSSFLEYEDVLPQNSINQRYDKYIVGANEIRQSVSFIFIVEKDTKIDSILKIIDETKITVNFFVDSIWFEKNNELLIDLIKNGHNVGNLSYNRDYGHGDFIWMNTVIKKIGGQKKGYCYSENINDNTLKFCALNKNYTIIPTIAVKKRPFLEVKEKLKSGDIISFPVNKTVADELKVIINYIKSKGLEIENLSQILEEKKK